MINKVSFLITCIFVLSPILANCQFHVWSFKTGGPAGDFGWEVTNDEEGNVYSTGIFSGTVDFDPGIGVFELTSAGSADAFIIKVNSSGKLIWAKSFSGTQTNQGLSIVVDTKGNSYITGFTQGTADFDPGTGDYPLTSAGLGDIFVCKIDPKGELVWARIMGGPKDDRGKSIAIDEFGNVYVVGSFIGTADFDPGPGLFELVGAGTDNVFVSKLDANGNLVWASKIGKETQAIGEDIEISSTGDIYLSGYFYGECDFDPDTSEFILTSEGEREIFVCKLNNEGKLIWAKRLGGPSVDYNYSMALDGESLYVSGNFNGTSDFDPGPGIFNLTSQASDDIVITKLTTDGDFVWAKSFGGPSMEICNSVTTDQNGNVYCAGRFTGTTDFDPGTNYFPITAKGLYDAFISKWSPDGDFIWVVPTGGSSGDETQSIHVDFNGNVVATGFFQTSVDFDTGPTNSNLNSNGGADIFTARFSPKSISGYVFQDIDKDCVKNQFETGLEDRRILIQPGDIIVQSNVSGLWTVDTLPPGDYVAHYDTSGQWEATCPSIASFTVQANNQHTPIPDFGMHSKMDCPSPYIGLVAPVFRRCAFQTIYFSACNLPTATEIFENGYVDIEFDPLIQFFHSKVDVTPIGPNQYRVFLPPLYPDQCFEFTIVVAVLCSAKVHQTLCVEAGIFPVDSCVYGGVNTILPPGLPPCAYQTERSHLEVEGWCDDNKIHFAIHNQGESGNGDMGCYSQTRLYIDGKLMLTDSLRLAGGMSDTLIFSGDGRTWRFEIDQHPGHIGSSHPNATVELCGNPKNWTPGIITMFPEDDADNVVEDYCSQVVASYDPNDKRGFPAGLENDHFIQPNIPLNYIIRFQNTGNDTAFNIIIRDTLDKNLDIFSVIDGPSSHDHEFTMYGNRILQWKFANILLPDSSTNLEGSQGFVAFTIKQNPDLEDETILFNAADIYFDYNDPIRTNTTWHTINRDIQFPTWTEKKELLLNDCHSVIFQGIQYDHPGTYWQLIEGDSQPDTLATLIIQLTFSEEDTLVNQIDNSLISQAKDASYQWMDCETNMIIPGETNQSYGPAEDGYYAVIISRFGCIDTSACIPFLINATSHLPTLQAISVFPNPAHDYIGLKFKNPVNDIEVQIHDLFGTLRFDHEYNDVSDLSLPVNYPAGIYYISLLLNGSTETFKIVIQNSD